MRNEQNRIARQGIDCASALGVHIAGVRGFESHAAHQSRQGLSPDSSRQHTVADVSKEYDAGLQRLAGGCDGGI